MFQYDSDHMVLALKDAPVDPRTGNKVIYNASWVATNNSMIGERNEEWVRRELDWFASGSDLLSDMEPPVPGAFQACAGKDGRVNSAYGHILFAEFGEDHGDLSLYDRIVNTLATEGKGTRHAVAIISDRNVHEMAHYNGRNDFICTNALNVMIDHEDKMHIIAQMRSMDAVWGYRADYSMWDFLMEKLLVDVQYCYPEVTRGSITFQVANLHVYPRHFDLLDRWADKVDDDLNRRAWRQWMDKTIRAELEANDPSN